MANLRRSLVINFFSTSGATLMKFVVSVLLARILSPSEIGVFSMTVVFDGIAQIFRDFGVAAYLQREHELTPDKIRSATAVAFGPTRKLSNSARSCRRTPSGSCFTRPRCAQTRAAGSARRNPLR